MKTLGGKMGAEGLNEIVDMEDISNEKRPLFLMTDDRELIEIGGQDIKTKKKKK